MFCVADTLLPAFSLTWSFEKLRQDAPAFTTTLHIPLTLLLLFSILMGLLAKEGQKALKAQKKEACVLLRVI